VTDIGDGFFGFSGFSRFFGFWVLRVLGSGFERSVQS
jgi:hypothetical protein